MSEGAAVKTDARRGWWWVSWVQSTKDFRPMTDPPNATILGWWCTGFDAEERAILCAAVLAKTERDAKRNVAIDWPESRGAEWRFSQPLESLELSDRFPLKGWAKERFERERGGQP